MEDVNINRIQEVETQIGGGLIEEVIQVAEGELQLVNTMAESKVLVIPTQTSEFWATPADF